MTDFDPDPDLADLRRTWGDAYRITWNGDHFRATHITSGQALNAENATHLRTLIRDHHSRRTADPRFLPGANVATSRTPSISGRRNRDS
jgi:hypothetical protein